MRLSRTLPMGADFQPDEGTRFRVWAPHRRQVTVVFEGDAHAPRADPSRQNAVDLKPDGDGYWSAAVPSAGAGTLYRFRLDDGGALFPDPASRFQPQGVPGPSQVVDPKRFRWTDSAWPGVARRGQVIYEMHIGTFTP